MKKAFRISAIIVVVILIFAAIIASTMSRPSNAEQVWDEKMTIGDMNAKNYFIVYSDLVCPYCIAFENAILEHEDEFHQYLEDNDILYEVRLSDFLYEYGEAHPISSRYSAVAAYCARNEGRFWDYYNKAVASVWNDFFKRDGKSAFGRLNANDNTYWINIGKSIGLNEKFENCVNDQEPLEEIVDNAKKTSKLVGGMPSFKLNRYSPPGFDLAGDWEDVKAYFNAGLNSY